MQSLWGTFKAFSGNSQWIDIVFGWYHANSIQSHERNRRSKIVGILTFIYRHNQPLPDLLWKQGLIAETFHQLDKKNEAWHFYILGSLSQGGWSHFPDSSTTVCVLKCFLGDRILFHVNHGVKVLNFKTVVIASSDTNGLYFEAMSL